MLDKVYLLHGNVLSLNGVILYIGRPRLFT